MSPADRARARHAGTGGAVECRLRRLWNRGTGVARGRKTPTIARVDDANEGRADVGASIVATGGSVAAGGALAAAREMRNASVRHVALPRTTTSSRKFPHSIRTSSRRRSKRENSTKGRHPALSRPDPPPARSRHSAALVILAWASRDACVSRRGRAPTPRAASLRADPRGRSGSRRGRPRCPPRAGRSTPRPRAPRHVAEPSRSSTRLAATSSSPRVATSASSTWSGTRRCVPPPTVIPTRGPLTTRNPTLPYRSAHPPRTGHAQRRRAIPRP